MNLPFVKHQNTPEKREYFFVVEIGLGSAQVALWSVVNSKPNILAVGNSVMWKSDNVESLIQSVDQSLGIACELGGITSENQPTKMILGLPSEWVSQDKINPNKLNWLKSLSEKLELKPVGFVTEHEAITSFIQQSEGVPVTAILLLVWPDYLETTLVRLGKVVGTVLVGKSQNLTEDVVESLARLPKVEVLPSRIFLSGSGVDMEQARQLLLNYAWTTPSKKFNFLHFPKIEILPLGFGAKAIASSAGNEMSELFGAIDSVNKKEPEKQIEESTLLASDFGFGEEDIANQNFKPEKVLEKVPEEKIKRNLSPMLYIIILIIILMVGGIGMVYWFVPRATVSIIVIPKSISQNIEVSMSSKVDKTDIEKSIVPAKVLEVEVKSESTIPTTGNKSIGDKATGTVVITNVSESIRALPAGTVITSSSGLKFVLDETLNVASASGSASNIQYGKATAKATAAQIGSDFNLSAGTIFRVGVFALTQLDAKNEVAFSGGTSRQVKSVAKEDILNLKNSLTEKIKTTAKDKIVTQIIESEEWVSESMTTTIISEDFSNKLDEPADNLKLSMQVKVRVFVYKKSDLDEIISSKVLSLSPEGYVSQHDLNKAFIVKQIDKEGVKFLLKITANMWPEIDKSKILKLYMGKAVDLSILDLKKIIGVEDVSIEIRPQLPLYGNKLPFREKNIEVKVVSK